MPRWVPSPGYAQVLISLRTTGTRVELFGEVPESSGWSIYDLFSVVKRRRLHRAPRALWAFVDAQGTVDYRSLTPDIGLLQHLQATTSVAARHTIEKIQLIRLTPDQKHGRRDG